MIGFKSFRPNHMIWLNLSEPARSERFFIYKLLLPIYRQLRLSFLSEKLVMIRLKISILQIKNEVFCTFFIFYNILLRIHQAIYSDRLNVGARNYRSWYNFQLSCKAPPHCLFSFGTVPPALKMKRMIRQLRYHEECRNVKTNEPLHSLSDSLQTSLNRNCFHYPCEGSDRVKDFLLWLLFSWSSLQAECCYACWCGMLQLCEKTGQLLHICSNNNHHNWKR